MSSTPIHIRHISEPIHVAGLSDHPLIFDYFHGIDYSSDCTTPLSLSPTSTTDHEPYCCCESCANTLMKVPNNSKLLGDPEQRVVKWAQVASFAENNLTNTRGC